MTVYLYFIQKIHKTIVHYANNFVDYYRTDRDTDKYKRQIRKIYICIVFIVIILQIFDITGRLVVTLEKERLRSGYKEILWNAKNQPAGLYIIILTQGNEIETKKIIYLK